jgi:hypothetical protein
MEVRASVAAEAQFRQMAGESVRVVAVTVVPEGVDAIGMLAGIPTGQVSPVRVIDARERQ